jgi:hypothetical protein
MEAKAAKVGMKINEQTTKYMIAARTILDEGRTLALGERNLEVVNEFVYLGALVKPKNDLRLEIQ